MTANLPAHRHHAGCGCYLPDGTPVVDQPLAPPAWTGPAVVHQHIHQAPPDRTLARFALGAGVGGGAVAAAVILGPVITAALAAMTVHLATAGTALVVMAWAVVTVIRVVTEARNRPAPPPARRSR
ncbi:hypothetical protein FNQ90_05275, partial [Streptomyces alkaliphilus]